MPHPWRITIADNASTDETWQIAQTLAWQHRDVTALHLDRKGRGLALRTAWEASDAAILCYMDVDLSTGLDALLPLVAPLLSGHSDVAIGSRLAPGAAVARGPRREAISRTYNLILRALFGVRFRDAQCGFKAIRADIAGKLLPEVVDDAWFFDTELLLLAEHNGLRIHEVPVDWIDDPDSRVHVRQTAIDDLRGVWRVARTFIAGRGRIDLGELGRPVLRDDMGRQLVSFAAIGAVSTALSLAIFLMLRSGAGPLAANAIALTATALANAWANRRFTFGSRTRHDRLRHYVGAIAVFVGGVAMSTGALLVARSAGGSVAFEVIALALSWAATSAARFTVLRRWIGSPPDRRATA
jgi:putative flippase GtrA